MRTVNRRDALLAGMAVVIASTARGAVTAKTSFSGAALEIDGQLAGFARSVGGGAISFAELQNVQGGQRVVANAPVADSFKLAFAPSAARKGFLHWGISSVGRGVVAASASIIYYAGPDEVARIALSNVSVGKFALTDVVSPGASLETVGFAIELNAAASNMQVRTVLAAKPPFLGLKLQGVSANLVIPGIIDQPDTVVAMTTLESRAAVQSPEPLILPIDLQLSGVALVPLLDWAREWSSGKRSERTALLRLLDARLGSEVGRIELLGVGIMSFQPPGFRSGSAEQLYVLDVRLSCRSIKADLKDIGN